MSWLIKSIHGMQNDGWDTNMAGTVSHMKVTKSGFGLTFGAIGGVFQRNSLDLLACPVKKMDWWLSLPPSTITMWTET